MQVDVRDLTMSYDDAGKIIEIFRGLSFHVPSGSSLAIIGESGVGKTTLLYLLGGLERPVSGEVTLGGITYSSLTNSRKLASFRAANVGFVFQFHQLLPELDAVENVAMPLLIRRERPAAAAARARELLERVGLSHRLRHRPGMLSGGEQQRVALARALAGRPGVLLADEPTGNLDHRTASEVRSLLLRLHHEEKTTLIIVTHSLELAESMDRVAELTPSGMNDRRATAAAVGSS